MDRGREATEEHHLFKQQNSGSVWQTSHFLAQACTSSRLSFLSPATIMRRDNDIACVDVFSCLSVNKISQGPADAS